jgi:hypothetical protein
MDTHGKIAAALHIINGLFWLLTLMVVALVFGGVAALAGLDQTADGKAVMNVIAGFATVIAGVVALVAIAEIVSAILYLQGSAAARIWLVVFSALALLNIPIGTAIGGYSLWALLRDEAIPARGGPGTVATA